MPPPKLYFNIICPPCRTILLLARTLRIDIQKEEVDILTKNYVEKLSKVNPQHTLPVLQDNELYICDSHSIGPYLIQKFSNNVTLYPEDLRTRALIDQRLHYDSGVLYPTLYRTIAPILFRNQYGLNVNDIVTIQHCYDFVNKILQNQQWLVGNRCTFADFSCLTSISTLDMIYPINAKNYPQLAQYLRQCEKLPHYAECNLAGLTKLAQVIEKKLLHLNNAIAKNREISTSSDSKSIGTTVK